MPSDEVSIRRVRRDGAMARWRDAAMPRWRDGRIDTLGRWLPAARRLELEREGFPLAGPGVRHDPSPTADTRALVDTLISAVEADDGISQPFKEKWLASVG